MVHLTQPVPHENENKTELDQFLVTYRTNFLAPEIISTLVATLSESLQKKDHEKHGQMVELIVVIFKNLLQIPKDAEYDEFGT